MEIFQLNKKIFEMLGIRSNQSIGGLNGKTAIAFLMYSLGCISTGLFLCREATTFSEFTETIYICSAFGVIGMAFISMKIKTKTLFKFFGAFEDVFELSAYQNTNLRIKFDNNYKYILGSINSSMLKRKFERSIGLVEKWSEIIFILTVILTPICGVMTTFIYSFFVYYFVTDLDSDAFLLPAPMW